jgi:hypothetical protein
MSNFPYFGHETYARKERYLHSLRTLSNTKEEISLYCNENEYQELKNYCQEHGLTNVNIKISNIWDYPNSKKMKNIKEKSNNFNFYHEIDWNKLYLLEKEFDKKYDYIYWVDVGISHNGLWLDRYNPYIEKCDGMSRTYECYSYTNLFNEFLFSKISNKIENKLINFSTTLMAHHPSSVEHILGPYDVTKISNTGNISISIGGFLGGHTSKIEWFINEFKTLSDKILNNEIISNHELILSFVVRNKPENFYTFVFNTWYHKDFIFNGFGDFKEEEREEFKNNFFKNTIQFVNFFDEILKI